MFGLLTVPLQRGDGIDVCVVAVPISKLPELIEKSKEAFEKSGLHTTIVSHALDGNFRIVRGESD
jgi:D-lactate dehydrogenase (cytochrome)